VTATSPPDWLVLGTVQLGIPYGVRRHTAAPDERSARAVLEAAWLCGVRTFDTSEAYGPAAGRLAGWLREHGRLNEVGVVTKVKSGGGNLASRSQAQLALFAGAARRTLLTHDAPDVESWLVVRRAALAAGAEAGVSAYTVAEVVAASLLDGCARIQAPGNALDERALSARGNAAVRLDVRSVLLQGLLVSAPKTAEARVPGGGRLATLVREAAAREGYGVVSLLVAAARAALGSGDRLVIGVDQPDQLDEILASAALPADAVERFRHALKAAHPIDASVLDPRRWSSL
jgi:aryl-alcohol dehydrogenase-like predicted oxidoreductase